MNGKSMLFAAGLLAMLPLAPAATQDDEDYEPRRCISLAVIDHTEVIDDQTVVFHMKNGDIFLNHLDRTCPTLAPGEVFSYRTASRQLCSVDFITVHPDFPRAGGISCRLGMFQPTDEGLLAILKGEEEEAEISVTPIEVEEE